MATETETIILTEPEEQVIHRVPRPPTEKELEQHGDTRPLMQKLREHYHDPKAKQSVSRMSNRAFIYFWFITLTEYYVMISYVVPYQYAEDGEDKVYWMKVWCAWVTIQASANWLCTRFYKCAYNKTNDRPDLRKSLWDDYIVETGQKNTQEVVDERTGFTWKYCKICEHMMPPRSHHCKICNKCMLKRDHHCYFTGVCIGFANQRYFFFLNFYCLLACITGLYHIYPYMMATFYETSDMWGWLLPVTIFRCLVTGSVEWNQLFMMFHLYSLWWIGVMAFGYTVLQLILVCAGATFHEMQKEAKLRITLTYTEKFQSVFGPFWFLGFIFPTILIFKQTGDGINWEKIKLYRPVRRVVTATGSSNNNKQQDTQPKRD